MIQINGTTYEIINDYRDGWKEEDFQKRYSDILNKYDYIVGDWGYNQLRLRGFYENENKNSTYENKKNAIGEYIYEYCNFGCPYFVLKKIGKADTKETTIEETEEKAQP
ncbi:hypothetical protein CIB95_14060 [Lottiidibacillus patelloidae]|uniref:Transcriptional regulator n=1 Tax=Lottiidibacillus patelloidae TaxID=2670334 RepID=A0A263BQV6_9BACI|nr:YutD family protein [Lottiidibacillus patelloidae]OZM55968.1 hypothetical protein CIB95_14060 [Lottiidibacillus patelloidae]